MSGAHTSGPWRTADGDAILAGHDGGLTVVGSIERPEDAALAAAAPELLEALEPFAAALLKADDQERRMVEAGMGAMSDNTKISWGIKRKDLRSAAAAIAKARGEA